MRLRTTTPVFLVADIASTLEWYQEMLDFDAEPFPPSPPHTFCILKRDDIVIMLQQLAGYQKRDLYDKRDGGVWNVYIETVGVYSLFEAISKRDSINMLESIRTQPYGQTEFVIGDPNGYVLVFAERTGGIS